MSGYDIKLRDKHQPFNANDIATVMNNDKVLSACISSDGMYLKFEIDILSCMWEVIDIVRHAHKNLSVTYDSLEEVEWLDDVEEVVGLREIVTVAGDEEE